MSEEITLGCFADLRYDMVFKKAFASETDKELLIALLNSFLERKLAKPIVDVAVKNPYIQGQTITSKDSIVDIRCRDSAGNSFIVEMQVSPQHFFVKRAIFYLCMSIADSSRKGENYDFNFPNTYSLNFVDFDIDFGKDCEEVVQYFSLSNEDHPEIRLNYANVIFVRLSRFHKTLGECESLQDKLLYSFCHAHECEEQPERLKGNVFDRLFTLIEISRFTSMELDDYKARMMFKADLREQLRYAEDKGIEIGRQENRQESYKEVLSLWRQGYSPEEAEKMLSVAKA
jgi:predicted transposase/invertase (TIGR01784 family)